MIIIHSAVFDKSNGAEQKETERTFNQRKDCGNTTKEK